MDVLGEKLTTARFIHTVGTLYRGARKGKIAGADLKDRFRLTCYHPSVAQVISRLYNSPIQKVTVEGQTELDIVVPFIRGILIGDGKTIADCFPTKYVSAGAGGKESLVCNGQAIVCERISYDEDYHDKTGAAQTSKRSFLMEIPPEKQKPCARMQKLQEVAEKGQVKILRIKDCPNKCTLKGDLYLRVPELEQIGIIDPIRLPVSSEEKSGGMAVPGLYRMINSLVEEFGSYNRVELIQIFDPDYRCSIPIVLTRSQKTVATPMRSKTTAYPPYLTVDPQWLRLYRAYQNANSDPTHYRELLEDFRRNRFRQTVRTFEAIGISIQGSESLTLTEEQIQSAKKMLFQHKSKWLDPENTEQPYHRFAIALATLFDGSTRFEQIRQKDYHTLIKLIDLGHDDQYSIFDHL